MPNFAVLNRLSLNEPDMEFRTEINLGRSSLGCIRHGNPIVMIGSCFTDNIGGYMSAQLFDAMVNPFGPIYNPQSVRRAIELLVRNERVRPEDLIVNEGRFHSFLFHSRYSGGGDAVEVAARMNERIAEAVRYLRDASYVIITLGTTKAYFLKGDDMVVANCHKLPACRFYTRSLDVAEVTEALDDVIRLVREVNSRAQFVFTVSPLRYLGGGVHENQLIKGTLLLAIDRIVGKYSEIAEYFPAYELMMDDLRDYRFYADDMCHPSVAAVKYIYEKFGDAYFDAETRKLADEASKLTRRLAHRTISGDALAEQSEKNRIAEDFLGKNPKLRQAYKRYIINGI